jgi:hypothetical protein
MTDLERKQGDFMFLDQATPEWMRGMFEHFNETGTYRAEDIQRVLGDPRQGVQIPTAPSMEVSYRASLTQRG